VVGLIDLLVRSENQAFGYREIECLRCFEVITNSKLANCNTGRTAGFSPLRTRPV
jgi:hypothetical protein